MKLLDDSILLKYVKIVLNQNFPETVQKSSDSFNFRCNICGDSQKSKRKKRGNITVYNGKLLYHCFNCGKSMLVKNWLKTYFPVHYKGYITESLQSNKSSKNETPFKSTKKVFDPNKYLKDFRSINDAHGKLFDKAVEFCKQRKIPKLIWKNWLICPNISSNQFRNRLIIPIYDKHNRIVYWTGRTLKNELPKYMNCSVPVKNAFDVLYEKIDKSKPVVCVEGYIDSLFIKNSLPLFSTNWNQEIDKMLEQIDCYYLLDIDSSKETKKRKINLLKQGRKIFNWKQYLKDKGISEREKWDVNDLYLYLNMDYLFTYEYFSKYFTSNIVDTINF